MKLDMSAAWDQAITMIRANREMVLILAGVFFFLPYLVFSLLLPNEAAGLAGAGTEAEMEEVMAALTAFYAEFWWAFIILAVTQSVGTLAILAVLGDPGRPTVGDAIQRGGKYLLPQLGAQILTALAVMAAPFLALLIGGLTGSEGITALLVLIAIPVAVYVVVKLSMTSPVIAIEKTGNPLAALSRSWRLTKGNSFRLFGFYLLLIVAFLVLSIVLSLVFGLLFALLGEGAELIGLGLFESLINAIFAVIIYAVLASIHKQLSAARATVPKTKAD